MSFESDAWDARVVAARAAGDERALCGELLGRANARMDVGRMAAARRDLDELAALHRDANRLGEALRCLHMAATAARFDGDVDGAMQRARQVWREAPDGSPPKVAAATELGESALRSGDGHSALGWYECALTHGQQAGMVLPAQAALLRRQGEAAAATGRFDLAALSMRQAGDLYGRAGNDDASLAVHLEEVSAWIAAKHYDEAVRVLRRIETHASRLGDEMSLAQIHLLWSTLSVERGELRDAARLADTARRHALVAVDPVSYTAAAVALSRIHDLLDEREAAYAALAVGWVTLGDLIGRELAQASFAPKLRELAEKWGRDAFEAARDAYRPSSASPSQRSDITTPR